MVIKFFYITASTVIMIFGYRLYNRVGSEGLFPPLSSHTTVRAVRHTAVRKDTDLL